MGGKNKLPAYMNALFNKIYAKPRLCSILDDPRVVKILTFGASDKLVKELLKDVSKNAHVLQIGLTFGREIDAVYNKVKKNGKFDIFDISEEQIGLAAKKYANYNMTITKHDASEPWDEKYDAVICYNLLRELPLKTRDKVMNNALSSLTTGGKVIFIDYAEPLFWNPIKWPLFWFNRLYRPFAESLWQKPVKSFCAQQNDYRWHTTLYHGGLFQKTVAVHKILSNEDVRKLTKLFHGK